MRKKEQGSLSSKLGYATGDILGGGAFALISLLFMKYLINVEGITPALAGVVVMIGKIWDAVSDPLMGMISDRTKTKSGRRRIYFLIGIIPIAVTFTMLWFSFGIESMFGKFAYYSLAYMLFSTAFTVVMVPYNALLTDMVDGYVQKSNYSTIRMLFSSISAMLSVVLPPIMLDKGISYPVMGMIFGIFYGLPLILTYLLTWENNREIEPSSFKDMFVQLGTSFKNKSYRSYLGVFIFGQMATDVATSMLAFWLGDVVLRSGQLSVMSGLTLGVAIILLPINNMIARKKGKHYPALYFQPIRIVALAVAFFFGATTPTILLIAICIIAGLGSSASAFVPWALLPDIPDSDEMITGTKNAGIYAGTSTFIRKFTSGVAIFLLGVIMDLFGYVESTEGVLVTQTAGVVLGIRILYCILPIALIVLTIYFASKYKLTKENYELIIEAIKIKRETGKPTTESTIISACEEVSGIKFEDMWVGKIDE